MAWFGEFFTKVAITLATLESFFEKEAKSLATFRAFRQNQANQRGRSGLARKKLKVTSVGGILKRRGHFCPRFVEFCKVEVKF